MQEFKHVMSTP